MAYRYGQRNQQTLFPKSIEEYVLEDDAVRAYDAFVEALDFKELGIILDTNKVGNSAYNPKSMLKLLVYGYSYGFRSSRKLERALHHNISFMWLLGGMKPDHKTIAEFRRKNKNALKEVLKQCARLCIELNLIAGNTLFVDGSKMRANASLNHRWTKERCKKNLEKVDKRIDEILIECEETDRQEKNLESLVKLQEELKDQNKLKSKIEQTLKKLKEEKLESVNTTDPDSVMVKSCHGVHSGYSAEIVVDEKHGLIVNSDTVSDSNDRRQFAEQINKANEVLGKKCEAACADTGYSNTTEMEKIDKQGIKVVVPSQRQVLKKEASQFSNINFKYDKEKDCYICPQGHELKYCSPNYVNNTRKYIIKKSSICSQCKHFGQCTKSKKGRTITRLMNGDYKERFEKQYNEKSSQEIYKLRKQKVELPFGHMKRNLKFDSFLIRGRTGVNAEMALLSTCFNIARMITIMGGVSALIEKIS